MKSCTGDIYFHVDVNSAFLAWEAAYRLHHLGEQLDLRTIPCVVGGDEKSRHGIVLAKSHPCKQYGIQTGESLMEARRKCPTLKVVPGRSGLYSRCSEALVELLQSYSPHVEQYSIDEAFLCMTGTELLHGDPVRVANQLREHIRDYLGFTVNIGVSTNRLLAKMASDFTKPDRVHTLWPEEVPTKMWPLPVTNLFYVGRATYPKLKILGIRTIGDLANADLIQLRSLLKSHADVIWNYANGRDLHEIMPSSAPMNRGVGNSCTIPYDIDHIDAASMVFLSLAEKVGMRLRKENLKVEVIAIGIKYSDFSYKSMQMTLKAATNITNEIHSCALQLFEQLWDHKKTIRHLGIHTSKAKDDMNYRQLSFSDVLESSVTDHPYLKYEKLEKADLMSDEIRKLYGIDAIKRARFVGESRR